MKPTSTLPPECKEAMRLHVAGSSVVKSCLKAGIARSEYSLLSKTEPFKAYMRELKALKTGSKGGVSTEDIDEMAVKIVHCALAGKKYKGEDVSLTTFRMAMEWIKNSHRVDTTEQTESMATGGIDKILKGIKDKGIDLESLSEDKLSEMKQTYDNNEDN